MDLKIYFADRKSPLCNAWKKDFNDTDVEIHEGDIFDLDVDAVVSPANSFGWMDGGFDYHLSEKFGWHIQEELTQQIHDRPMGELLVGQALVVETGDKETPYLVIAPTMRVPMNFGIPSSVNAYLAMKAALIAAKKHVGITSIAFTGFCTGVGGMPPKICSLQMKAAYDEIILGMKTKSKGFHDTQTFQFDLNHLGKIYG